MAAIPAEGYVDYPQIRRQARASATSAGIPVSELTFPTYMHATIAVNLPSPLPIKQALAFPGVCPFTVTLGKLGIFKHEKEDILKIEVIDDASQSLLHLHQLILKVAHLQWPWPDFNAHITISIGPTGAFDALLQNYAAQTNPGEGTRIRVNEVVAKNWDEDPIPLKMHPCHEL